MRHHEIIDSIFEIIQNAKKQKIIHLFTSEDTISGSHIKINGKEMINFGSCSYLGLELNKKLKRGATEAIEKFGTQFSSSRSYVSLGLYEQLEEMLCQIFEAHCILAPSTTLGNIAAIPVLVQDNDAVIIDHQAHNCLHTAVALLKARKVHVELLRHNKMDDLEKKIGALKNKYRNIWYVADGVYSMYGDTCPAKYLEQLLNKYDQFRVYIDDAHGMSWSGKKGKGYVLNEIELHERMVVATSLAKSFGVVGGVLIFPNKMMKEKVRSCGGPLIFSGPIQPANLGAAIASAQIHLSVEIEEMQAALKKKIEYANMLIKQLDLPLISFSNSPIFFIGVSLPRIAYAVIQKLMDRGYYVNLGIYPAVPMKNTGIRFTITCLQSNEEIKSMLYSLKSILDECIEKEGFSYEKIYKSFKKKVPETIKNKIVTQNKKLIINHFSSISEIEKTTWDRLFESRGILDNNSIQLMEKSFTGNTKEPQNFEFDYYIIKDPNDQIVLATYTTKSLYKEDMMHSRDISEKIELKRKSNPNYLVSKTLSLGIPFGERDQMYLDRKHNLWKDALTLFLEEISKKQYNTQINQIIMSGFVSPTVEFEKIFHENGYIKFKTPESYYIDNLDWKDLPEFKSRMSKAAKRGFRNHIQHNHHKFFSHEIIDKSKMDIDHWYKLYLNVKKNNLSINTFELPFKFFKSIASDKDWHIIEMFPKKEFELENYDQKCACVVLIHSQKTNLTPAIIGFDYAYQTELRIYNCMLYEIVNWAKQNGYEKINLGYTAGREKKKVGAKEQEAYGFTQLEDDFNMKMMNEMTK